LLTKSDLVRRYLLSLTLEHAVSNSKYYKDKIGNDLAKKVSTLSDIRRLPILYRETFVRRQEQIRCIKEFPDYLVHTSGMTGEQISVPIYKREIEAYRDLVLEQIKLPYPLPLTLSIMDSSNTTKACLKFLPAIDAHINNRTEQIVKILQKKYNYHNSVDSSITIIQASLLSIRRLTMQLLDHGYNPSTFGINLLSSNGWLITKHSWKFLEEIWNASLDDRYGITEVHGNAKYCPMCKWYHFDFTVIPEIVHPLTLLPIKHGVGVLLLTGLYPFNQGQPIIRYWTGDLVEIKSNLCKLNEPSYKFKGRTTNTIYYVKSEKIYYLLFPTDVAQILDEFPDIARDEVGFLKFKVQGSFNTSPFDVRVLIELCYDPKRSPNNAHEVKERILESLSKTNNTLTHFIEKGMVNFNVELFAAGKLESFTKV
jgi:phenylacetate-coenzyme A ligase PaaK-like adenylate-forming protein